VDAVGMRLWLLNAVYFVFYTSVFYVSRNVIKMYILYLWA